ncbi:MAG: cytochrome c family protein [Rhodobacteraceae bacterium]|nr:cytochrome c family protein [Paracoccaceae bacterium]
MLDTMTATKTVGAVCGALLFFLLAEWVGSSIYHVGGTDHGDGHSGSVIFADLEPAHDEPAAESGESMDMEALLAGADAERGKKVFAKCKACHKADEATNGVGPHLVAILGRQAGAVEDFNYSKALNNFGGVWDVQNIFDYVADPKKFLPGTKMSFAGLKKQADKLNVIAYLKSLAE